MEFPRVMYTEEGRSVMVETEKTGEKYFKLPPHKRVDELPKKKAKAKKAVKKASK
jgi:hypothetical protein